MCETWTNNNHSNDELNIDNYKVISRCDRTDTSAGIGGGLLVYSKTNINATEVKNTSTDKTFNQFSQIKVNSDNDNEDIQIYLIYRPHKLYNDDNVKTNNENLTKLIKSSRGHSIFVGDFNYRDIDWQNNMAVDSQSNLFLDATNDCFLSQLVTFPTHISGSLLDLVLTSHPNLIQSVEDIGYIGKSDHRAIKIEVKSGIKCDNNQRIIDDWKNADIGLMKDCLSQYNWQESFSQISTEQAWLKFKEVLFEAKNQHVPKKLVNNSKKPPWITKDILKLLNKKKRLWKKYKNSNLQQDLLIYKEGEKILKRSIRNSKKNYERKLGNDAKNNPKKFYSYLKSKSSNKESIGPLKKLDGSETKNDIEVAETLNDFFGTVFTEEDLDNMPVLDTILADVPMTEVIFSTEKVMKKIDNLKLYSAPGPDGITPKILKTFSEQISLPLSMIYQKSYDSGEVPTDWKKANVTPIFKKGKKCLAINHRPVSLTPVPCKIMESIIKDDVTEYLEENKLINNSQHGFRQKRSCLTNLLEYMEEVTKTVDSGQNIDMIYLDFSKAFDKVPIKRLLIKVRALGIDEKTVKWIEGWLKERMQRVVINGKFSHWILVISGVPQGSVLGPLLFIIFINDIDEMIQLRNAILKKFADDTKYGKIILDSESADELQNDLNKLVDWADTWQMKFNSDKCKVIHFGRGNPMFNYTMNGHAPAGSLLESVNEEKDVGVWISSTLKPSFNCQKAANKANSVLGQMARAVSYRDRITWVKLYKQYVRPHLEYCAQAWSPWLEQDKKLLEKVQERAIRMVSGLNSRVYKDRLKELGLQSLQDRRVRGDMIQVWKILHSHDNLDKKDFFQPVNQNHQLTRLRAGNLNLQKQRANTDIRKFSFSVRVTDNWNVLPSTLKEAGNINIFKRLYDKLIS